MSATEEEVYERLGLPWIPPPLREDEGQIEAALRDQLPRLVEPGDLRGDLHTHTDLTDGIAALEDMVAAAAARGWLTPDDVVNTWPLERLRAYLHSPRPWPS